MWQGRRVLITGHTGFTGTATSLVIPPVLAHGFQALGGGMNCRRCREPLTRRLVDLGAAPPSNAYLTAEALHVPERWYPLRVLVCEACWLVQAEDGAAAEELFTAEYAYFSGFSATWIAHVEAYVAAMVERFALGPQSHVVEVAANDGSLLECVRQRGIRYLGIEPTTSTADAARAKDDFLRFLLAAKRAGKKVAGYGAAAKGNTLLNFAGVRPDLLRCVADRNPAKQGRFLPGSRIPIVDERHLVAMQPDYVVILPWNMRREVIDQLAGLAATGCRFVTAVPRLEVLSSLPRRCAA